LNGNFSEKSWLLPFVFRVYAVPWVRLYVTGINSHYLWGAVTVCDILFRARIAQDNLRTQNKQNQKQKKKPKLNKEKAS